MSKAPFTVAFCPVRNRASPARSAIPDRQHCASPEASPEKCPVISAEPPDSCKSWSLPKACFRTASRISSSFPGTLLNEICLTEYDVDLGDVTFAAEMYPFFRTFGLGYLPPEILSLDFLAFL
ncbi:hypothetical protein M0657_011799 [Pyricularia oryzae]|nr:hypothetical protein M9X92_011754 [Pyricularia oryzae]KAI7909547.1 hypothetical protein M0657_011799 [Pyricularia oryzae]